MTASRWRSRWDRIMFCWIFCLSSDVVKVFVVSCNVFRVFLFPSMCLGSHGWAVGFGLSPVQRYVPDLCSRPAGLGLEFGGSQSPMEPHTGGKWTCDRWMLDNGWLTKLNFGSIIDSRILDDERIIHSWMLDDGWMTASLEDWLLFFIPQEHGHCADFHPSGAVVAIGTHSGKSVLII